jgi:hypothetical protein
MTTTTTETSNEHGGRSFPSALRSATTITPAAFIALLVGCIESSSHESFEIPEPVEHVVVRVDTGEVRVSGSDSITGARVDVELNCRTVVPGYEVRAADGTLRVALDADTDASACTGRFAIVVPRQASLDLRTGAGDVVVADLRGNVSVVTYDGSVTLANVAGPLEVTVPAGDVVGDGIGSTATTVTVGAGNVRLAHAAAPVQVDLAVIMGDVEVTVPAGAYDIEAEAISGTVHVSGIDELHEAPNGIRLGTERGDITVTGYEADGPERLDLGSLRTTNDAHSTSTDAANQPLPVWPAAEQPNSSST